MQISFFKFIAGILVSALFALFYVHQEIEIVKTSFLVNKHHRQVSFLLDQYRSLVYNLSSLESPRRIENTLCVNEITLCMPKVEDKRHLGQIGLAYKGEKTAKKDTASFLAHMLDRFSTKAEAKVE